MQIRSFRGSGEPARVIALSNARDGLGPDPRRALGPAAIRAASTGRTRDRTRPMLQKRQKVLARAPSTRDPGCVKTLRGIIAPGILGSPPRPKADIDDPLRAISNCGWSRYTAPSSEPGNCSHERKYLRRKDRF